MKPVKHAVFVKHLEMYRWNGKIKYHTNLSYAHDLDIEFIDVKVVNFPVQGLQYSV